MYSSEIISQIHKQLQTIAPHNQVLLGGSYLYGEANDESDVDFYCICPWWQFFVLNNFKRKIHDVKENYPEIHFSVMLVPKWLLRTGYYIYGQTTKGEVCSWPLPYAALVRNCVKLAYFNYLRFLVVPENKVRNLAKAAKQLAVAKLAARGEINFKEPIFSWRYLRSHLGNFAETESDVGAVLRAAPEQFGRFFCFSWSNYILYNAKFLLRGNPLFLFANPDKMILKIVSDGFKKSSNFSELYSRIRKIVFPVVIV